MYNKYKEIKGESDSIYVIIDKCAESISWYRFQTNVCECILVFSSLLRRRQFVFLHLEFEISHYKSSLQHFLIFLISDNKKNIPKDLNKSLLFIQHWEHYKRSRVKSQIYFLVFWLSTSQVQFVQVLNNNGSLSLIAFSQR